MVVVKTKNNFLIYLLTIVLASIAIFFYLNQQEGIQSKKPEITNNSINKGNCLADDCLLVENLEYPVGELSDTAKQSLNEAIADEYKALGFYEAVIAKFGQVRPFSMIKGAEETHISSLKNIYDKYGLSAPPKPTSNKFTVPATINESCQIGYEAEIANAKLYRENLLPTVTSYPDISQIFTNLMNASEQKHLAAFDKCR